MINKKKMLPNSKSACGRLVAGNFFLLIVLAAMGFYQFRQKVAKDNLALIILAGNKPTLFESYGRYIDTVIYSGIVIIFGFLYKKLAAHNTFMENHRYITQYDNSLITKLFQFNFFNFYMPMILVAFYE